MLYVATKHKNIVMYVCCDSSDVDVHNDGRIIVWMMEDAKEERDP